jgi:hypothetical protein
VGDGGALLVRWRRAASRLYQTVKSLRKWTVVGRNADIVLPVFCADADRRALGARGATEGPKRHSTRKLSVLAAAMAILLALSGAVVDARWTGI